MKKKKSLILLYSLLFVVMLLLVQQIGAWLMDDYQTKSYTFESGEVKYELTGEFIDSGLIMPAQELLQAPFVITNDSTVKTEIRMQLIITLSDENLDADIAILQLGEGWVYEDGYYYYRGLNSSLVDGKYEISPEDQVITIISSYKLNGAIVRNNYSNVIVTTSFVFQTKQSDFVTWEYLGTANFDFETGEKND